MPSPEQESAQQTNRWDIDAAVGALNADQQRVEDFFAGVGFRLNIPKTSANPPGQLDLFPDAFADAGLARFKTQSFQMDMRVTSFHVEARHLTIECSGEDELVVLAFKPWGTVTFSVDVGRQDKEIGSSEAAGGPSPKERPDETKSETAPGAEDAAPEQAPGEAGEEHPRLNLVGRVGASPAFRTTPKGTLLARFPLAVHDEEGKTTWRTILAFGDRAEKLKGSLNKGQVVEVIGYLHTREMQKRDGSKKTVEEIYAVAVRSPRNTQSGGNEGS